MRHQYEEKDIVGIGLGPSNLALAVALFENQNTYTHNDFLFLEKSQKVSWHPGMMLENTRLQVPFTKDLVTLRNPTSYFSFLNYLKNQNRLNEFINTGETSPTRQEYTMYLNWVKDELPDESTSFGKRVVKVIPEKDSSRITDLVVEYEDVNTKEKSHFLTKNLVVAVGGKPYIPKVFKDHISERIFHSSDFKGESSKWPTDKPLRIGVIGSGQSSAEIIDNIHNKLPKAEIHSIMRRPAFRPEDDSQFINQVFFPEHVDFMYGLDHDKRKYLLDSYWNANYSAVNLSLIESLYSKIYQDKVTGNDRIHILNHTEPYHLEENDSLELHIKNLMLQETEKISLDYIVLATGYDRVSLPSFMSELKPYLSFNNEGLNVDRTYRVKTQENFEPEIYVQGMSESIHGITNSLLSILPIRAGEIAESLSEKRNLVLTP